MKKILRIEVRKGCGLRIGEHIVLHVEEKSGNRARLRFEFDEPTEVTRIEAQQEAATPAARVEGMAGA